jgi:putative membrane protein
MNGRIFVALATATTLLGTGGPLLAQQTTPPSAPATTSESTTKPPSGMSRSDRDFMTKVAGDSLAEIELGRLAAERGQSDAVKQFGQRMVSDHTKANDELKRLADQKGVTLPTQLDKTHARTRDRLAKLDAAAFDREFVKDMVRDHKKDVSAFQRESQKAKDPDLKSWAGQTLPTLQDHLKAAQDLQATVAAKK